MPLILWIQILLWLFVSVSRADEVALIRVSDRWSLLPAEPGMNGHDWKQIEFNDSQWFTGISGFSGGYYGGDEATSFGLAAQNWISFLFRKHFTVPDPNGIKWLVLRIDYNDGFVAYLNGREVARRNLPGETGTVVPFTQSATNFHSRGLTEQIDISHAVSWLRSGTNVLAIQLHSTGVFDYTVCLVPELLANFQRGPFIQSMSTKSVTVSWKTPVLSDSEVEFGTDKARLNNSISDTNLVTSHSIILTNLEPDTEYFYRVRSNDAAGNSAISPVENFRTFKAQGELEFAVLGDSGSGLEAQYKVAQRMQESGVDLVLHAGDVIYPMFTHEQADTRCISVYGPHMKNVPYFFAIGNHDLNAGEAPFLDAFFLPTNSFSGTEHYYSFDHGDAHFTVLFAPFFSQYYMKEGDLQHQWLVSDLAMSKKPWKFILMHHPMNTSSAHRRDDYNFNGIQDRIELSNVIMPLAAKHGVQVVFSGHDHCYERFTATNGVNLIVTGGGGGTLYGHYEADLSSSQFWSRYHFTKVSVQGATLTLSAVGLEGKVFDSLTISQKNSTNLLHESSWHTPRSVHGLDLDNDGNWMEQEFDMSGSSQPAVAGQASNLGRLFVNNDKTNLYLGLANTSIHPFQDILLFLESPKLSGVTNMSSIGNGILDPANQGADALDFLSNVTFKDFSPAIACILGDELADFQARSFVRTNTLSSGQGAFRLTDLLEDVEGVSIQQFNRNPQFSPVTFEQNADFIVISIPYESLGDIGPGDRIRLAAIVADGAPDIVRETRRLDSGFIGRSFTLSTPSVLEPLEVRLAPDPDIDSDGLSNDREVALGTLPGNPDSDSDGLTDGWEVQFGLDPLSDSEVNGANGDPDKDGLTNLAEQGAGTDPRSLTSTLRAAIHQIGKDTYRLSWRATIGKRYRLESAPNPGGPFKEVPQMNQPIISPSGEAYWVLDMAKENHQKACFYRIRVGP